MTNNPLQLATRKVLNDPRIFRMFPILFNKVEWAKLRKAIQDNDTLLTQQLIKTARDSLNEKLRTERDQNRRRDLESAQTLLNGFEAKIREPSAMLTQVFETLDSFGSLWCYLPNTEDYGKIIEGQSRPTVEHFFLYKIDKAERDREALVALFEVVKELYEQRVEPLQIAFFVRKIKSLNQFVEVLR